MSQVRRVLVRNTVKNRVKEIVRESFHSFLPREEARGASFVVKPNLGFKTDARGGTTSIDIIEATLEVIRDEYQPSHLYVVETDGIAFRCEDVFAYLKLDSVCLRYGAEFKNLSREPTVRVENHKLNILKSFAMPRLFMADNTRLINLAKIKTHEIARFSGAIKNMFGLNPYTFKVKYHPEIDLVLQDFYHLFKPDLNIVDGIWAIDGHGPWTGEPVNLNVVVASNDALAADMECLKIIGWGAEDVPYIKRIKAAESDLTYTVDAETIDTKNFTWHPPAKLGQLKERGARALVPLLMRGMPLFYYSHGTFKLIQYGEKGRYCRSIKSFPDGGSQ